MLWLPVRHNLYKPHHQTGIDETLAKNMCKVVTKLIIAHHSNNKAIVITMTKK